MARSFKVLVALVLLALPILMARTPAAAAPPEAAPAATTFVRVPAGAETALAGLALRPIVSLDYGSFRWLELSPADYAALVSSGTAHTVVPDAGQIRVPNYQFDPRAEGEPKLEEALRSDSPAVGLRLVQLTGPTQEGWVEALEAQGLPVLQYYPHQSYLTWASATTTAAAESLSFVRWQGPFQPAYKINSDLAGRTGRITNVDVMFYNDGNVEQTLNQLRALGATVLQANPAQADRAFYDAIVTLDASAVVAVAQLPTVLWLGYASPEPGLEDEMSSQIMAGNYSPAGVPFVGYNSWLSSVGVNGTGVTWAVVDTGVDYQHPDLNTHIVGGYSFPGACNPAGEPGSDCSGGGHGTHVAGIIGGDATGGFADANGFKYGLGIAPEYGIFAMNSLSASAWPPAGGWQEHSKRAVLGGAIGGNNSWTTGEGTNHGYQASERTHDLMVRDGNFDTTTVAEPFIEVFSAGNSGPGGRTLTAPKEAKNLIVVASSQNYRVGSIDTISSFSSRGPAVDGRWVPTVAAPGEQIASSRNDLGGSCSTAIAGTSNLYAFCSGTSMAAPQVSGALVLATQWWRTTHGGANPSPAMAKALLVNSAVDMGTADIPNVNEGWGRVHMDHLLRPPAPTLYFDQSTILGATGDSYTLPVGIADPTKPLKITLAWTDAAGAVGANPALVNNLDLRVQVGGTTYLGNVFSGGWSATGGTPDAINNLENVYVQNPSGAVTITVTGTAIVGDGIPYNGDPTDQDFALICHNCLQEADFALTANPSSLALCAPTSATSQITVDSILGFNEAVTLSALGVPSGTTAAFAPNPVTPPGNSTMTLNVGAGTAPGSYPITVRGVSATKTHDTTVNLTVSTAAPAAPTLLTPPNGAANLSPTPTFTWNAVPQAASYVLEIATDAAFTTIVHTSPSLTGTTYTVPVALNTNTVYYWRVRATNACGTGTNSAPFSFTTEAAPGECSIGTTPQIHYSTDFESGADGWTTTGSTGASTWALSTARSHSPTTSFLAVDLPSVSDQRLISPPIALPAGNSGYTLAFWNDQTMEPRSGGCYDGGLLEVSTDAGATWVQVPNADLLTRPYDGPISTTFGNPLAGRDAWCGNPRPWERYIVNLNSYAGQTVQFRFRLGSDSSAGRAPHGWYVDDVQVQSCTQQGGPTVTPTNTPVVTMTATATVTATVPGATVTATVPGATVTATVPGATVTATVPGATVTATVPPTSIELGSLGEQGASGTGWIFALAGLTLVTLGLIHRRRR